MVRFRTTLLKFGKMGEKTGWTYFEISASVAKKINPGVKKSYRVKGRIDSFTIKGVALLPMGEGSFIIPFNASMRKATRKKAGDKIEVVLEEDKSEFIFNADFMVCLEDEPGAVRFFKTLSGSHQRYFSKWIDSAKTEATRAKRIAQAVNALSRKQGFPQMLRALKALRDQ